MAEACDLERHPVHGRIVVWAPSVPVPDEPALARMVVAHFVGIQEGEQLGVAGVRVVVPGCCLRDLTRQLERKAPAREEDFFFFLL